MSFQEAQRAVFEAYQAQDYKRCFTLLDAFIEQASGENLGRALALKAGAILLMDRRRAAEGLTLVDEAHPLLEPDPAEAFRNVVTALGLCYALGDVERAKQYELSGNKLIQQHDRLLEVREVVFRFHLNLGQLAVCRGDYVLAYWHFQQGLAHLMNSFGADAPHVHPFLFWLHLNIAWACLHMDRHPEAREALDEAERHAVADYLRIRWGVVQAEYLRRVGSPAEALTYLDSLPSSPDAWTSDSRILSAMTRAKAYRDIGDVRQFHRWLSEAKQEAIESMDDYLLSEIQRIMRSNP